MGSKKDILCSNIPLTLTLYRVNNRSLYSAESVPPPPHSFFEVKGASLLRSSLRVPRRVSEPSRRRLVRFRGVRVRTPLSLLRLSGDLPPFLLFVYITGLILRRFVDNTQEPAQKGRYPEIVYLVYLRYVRACTRVCVVVKRGVEVD